MKPVLTLSSSLRFLMLIPIPLVSVFLGPTPVKFLVKIKATTGLITAKNVFWQDKMPQVFTELDNRPRDFTMHRL
jgi:hypothetical protein